MVAAVNSEEVLRSTLLASREYELAQDTIYLKGYPSASKAYNTGINNSASDILIFVHQDVYLPPGWILALIKCLQELEAKDANWGVAGIAGITAAGETVGFAYSTGLKRYIGEPFQHPILVRTLDEIVLIIKRNSRLYFDEKLPGFHLYGTDICLEAEKRGLRNYVIPCFVLHNSCGIKWLPMDFWRAYLYLRNKWRDRLPIITSCTKITRTCAPVFRHFIERGWVNFRGKNKPGLRVADPRRFYEEYLKPTMGADSINL